MVAALSVARRQCRDLIVLEKQNPAFGHPGSWCADASPDSVRSGLGTVDKLTSELGYAIPSAQNGYTIAADLVDYPGDFATLTAHPIDVATSYVRHVIAGTLGKFVGDELMQRVFDRSATTDAEPQLTPPFNGAQSVFSSIEERFARPDATTAL